VGATHEKNMISDQDKNIEEQLRQLFGSYKAEWLQERLYELFTEPAYFPELTTTRSCILIGGRGTGKTTVLRGLSYEGQAALKGNHNSIIDWKFYGLYYRVNTNHVTAFNGPELTTKEWSSLFAHYMNLLLCDLLLEFVEWFEIRTGKTIDLDQLICRRISASLHLPECTSHKKIRQSLIDSRIEFEAYINNVVDAERPKLSMQAAPVDGLCNALRELDEFKKAQFFILFDEYENLLDYQQQVVNTLIKHASDAYCFKIGVRELGWRCRSTLNENEQLTHPADYAKIDISEKLSGSTFKEFALSVCQARIDRIQLRQDGTCFNLRDSLESLSSEEEAEKLGVRKVSDEIARKLKDTLKDNDSELNEITPLEFYFMQYWAESKEISLLEVFKERLDRPEKWRERFGNYRHLLLYTIRRGKRGIRKYYCGWDTYTLMAAGNIRFVLELVDQCLVKLAQEEGCVDSPISPEIQTRVAQQVGKMNLSELEGLSVDGAQLTKLLLSLGRVFQVMASDAVGHTPEVNQFQLSVTRKKDGSLDAESNAAEKLLNSAVMHLALVRSLGNKPGDIGDTKDYDYMIHPIYSGLFEISPRRKRKTTLLPNEVLSLIRKPKETIRRVLKENNRSLESHLPEQLTLFERFYDADS
jgi:hypothetical protein